jgi:hypothetical protein
VLFGALDQRIHVLGLEQFDQLVLGQLRVSVLSATRKSNKLTECMSAFGLFPG